MKRTSDGFYLDTCDELVKYHVKAARAGGRHGGERHTNLIIHTRLLIFNVFLELLQSGSIRSGAVCLEHLDISAWQMSISYCI